MSKKEYKQIKQQTNAQMNSLAQRIVEAFGGADNIETVCCCATRLRVTVKDATKVVSDADWLAHLEALGLVHQGNSYQVIYGVQVGVITTEVKDLLGLD